jgi:hypothetical protein
MRAKPPEIIFEKVHLSTDNGRAVCGTTRHTAEQILRVTQQEKSVTCLKCLRMLRFVDRARIGGRELA